VVRQSATKGGSQDHTRHQRGTAKKWYARRVEVAEYWEKKEPVLNRSAKLPVKLFTSWRVREAGWEGSKKGMADAALGLIKARARLLGRGVFGNFQGKTEEVRGPRTRDERRDKGCRSEPIRCRERTAAGTISCEPENRAHKQQTGRKKRGVSSNCLSFAPPTAEKRLTCELDRKKA